MAEFQEVIKQKMRMCDRFSDGFHCSTDCPITKVKLSTCVHYLISSPQEAEEIIMKWAEEHPIQTNADKFKEVFGYEVRMSTTCPGFKCIHANDSIHCEECELSRFWEKEYKEPKE